MVLNSLNMRYLILCLLLSITGTSAANSSFAITDFELLDLTLSLSDPKKAAANDQKEQEKLIMIDELIRKGIAEIEGYSMLSVSAEARSKADKSVGYLFDCASCSAELGRQYDADYILIGRLHKPTYLFSYLIVRIFDTKTNKLVKEYRSEVKGKPSKAVPGAVANLLIKIQRDIPVH